MHTIYLLRRPKCGSVLPGYAVGKLGLKEMALQYCIDAYDSERRDLAAMPFELTDKTLTVLDDTDSITFYIHSRELVA